MDRQDIADLWALLAVFRPRDPHLRDKTLRAAWAMVLEPYGRDDVRKAVAEYFRESKYWPDVTDIARRCPKPAGAADPEDHLEAMRRAKPSPEQRSREEAMHAGYRSYRAALEAAGLPSLSQARAQGMRCADWDALTQGAGIWLEDFLSAEESHA